MSAPEMLQVVDFFVPGAPQPQGSAKAFVVAGKARITSDNPKLHSWRMDVASMAQRANCSAAVTTGRLWHSPVSLTVQFYLPRPRGHFGTGRNEALLRPGAPMYPAVKPDLDKLVRAVGDALTGVIWGDDAHVVAIDARERYAGPDELVGTHITVKEMPR